MRNQAGAATSQPVQFRVVAIGFTGMCTGAQFKQFIAVYLCIQYSLQRLIQASKAVQVTFIDRDYTVVFPVSGIGDLPFMFTDLCDRDGLAFVTLDAVARREPDTPEWRRLPCIGAGFTRRHKQDCDGALITVEYRAQPHL